MNSRRAVLLLALALVITGPSRGWAQTETEPNNTCATAQQIAVPSLPLSVTGGLEVQDVDFYRFAVTPGRVVIATLEGQTTGKGTLEDPFMGLFDSQCHLITVDDDGAGDLNSRIGFTVPADGIVILAVTSCCDDSFTGSSSAGTYRLTLDAGGVIAGAIRDGGGHPVDPDFVGAFTLDGQFAGEGNVTCCASGSSYEVFLSPGTYRLVVDGVGDRRWYKDAKSFATGQNLTLHADERIAGIDFTLVGRVQIRPRFNQQDYAPGDTVRLDLEVLNPSANAATVVASLKAIIPAEPQISQGFCCFEDEVSLLPATTATVPAGADTIVRDYLTYQFTGNEQDGFYLVCATVIQDGISNEFCDGFGTEGPTGDGARKSLFKAGRKH